MTIPRFQFPAVQAWSRLFAVPLDSRLSFATLLDVPER